MVAYRAAISTNLTFSHGISLFHRIGSHRRETLTCRLAPRASGTSVRSELERHEAAAAIQACHLARSSRKAFRETLQIARQTRAAVRAQRQAERDSNSLMAQQGTIDLPALRVGPIA